MYLIFFGYFVVEGLIYLFWLIWLVSLGFGVSQIGLLIVVVYWLQVIVGVVLIYVVDWCIDQLCLVILLVVLVGVCVLLFQLVEGLLLFIVLSVFYGVFWISVLLFIEFYLFKCDKVVLQNYGWVCVVGLLVFIFIVILGGLLFGWFGQ